MTPAWYIASVAARRELKVDEGLRDEQGFTTYLPVETRWRRSPSGRLKVKTKLPLFAGYLFVQIDDAHGFAALKATDGVRGVLMADGEPLSLGASLDENEQLREIRQLERAGQFDYTKRRKIIYEPKQLVRIAKGPFTGFMAEILHAVEGERIRVLFKALGGGTMSVDDDDIELAQQPQRAA